MRKQKKTYDFESDQIKHKKIQTSQFIISFDAVEIVDKTKVLGDGAGGDQRL